MDNIDHYYGGSTIIIVAPLFINIFDWIIMSWGSTGGQLGVPMGDSTPQKNQCFSGDLGG